MFLNFRNLRTLSPHKKSFLKITYISYTRHGNP